MIKHPEIETISIDNFGKHYSTSLYRGVTKKGVSSEFDDVIVLAPGWLGSGTLHFAASHLAQKGHDVAVVNHGRTSILHPNKDRSQHVHLTAKAASKKLHKPGVILVGHSLGNRDVHSAAIEAISRQDKYPNDTSLYRINAIGAVAGVGLSGRMINGEQFYNELIFASDELLGHPIEELQVVGRSLSNLARNPMLRIIEGVSAAKCDVRQSAKNFIRKTVPRSYVESYMDRDGVISLPTDRIGFHMQPGIHMTPIIDGDVIGEIASQLYEPNNPIELEIAC